MATTDQAVVTSNAPHSDNPQPDVDTPADQTTQKTTSGAAADSRDTTAAGQPPSAVASPAISFQAKGVSETTEMGIDLPENEVRALVELKLLLREALSKNELLPDQTPPPPPPLQPQPIAVSAVEEGVAGEKTAAAASYGPPPAAVAEEEKQVTDEELVAVGGDSTVTKVSLDEDGANCRTVEAIEESVVSSSSQPLTSESSNTGGVDQPREEPTHRTPPPPPSQPPSVAGADVSIWGIPLLDDERSDVVLWKFLRARDFKPSEAFAMLKATLRWRKQFKIDEMMLTNETEFEPEDRDLGRVVFMHGFSKEGHPVCYNVYGEFENKELYQRTFSDEEKRMRFLRWRIILLERSIRTLDFRPGGISTILQVNDLRNSPGIGKWELRQATKQALQLLQDNYPEFVAKQVFINVPWWYVAASKVISPFLTQRSKSKFVVAGPSKSAETIFNYIDAELVPVQYGGLSRDGEFSVGDTATQIIIKPASKETVEFSVTEDCHLTWEVRVLGWEVRYGAEFVPNAEDGYTVIIQKPRKVGLVGGEEKEAIISGSFKAGEPGRVILTIDNSTSRKKRLLYRLKTKPCRD